MMNELYLIVFAAILPAILLTLYIWLRDEYQREPFSQVLKGVLFGIISALLAMAIESSFVALEMVDYLPNSVVSAIWTAFVGAAIPEEFSKLLMLWLLLRKNKYFDERMDGIVYACAIGMGFAGTENILYLFRNMAQWETVAVARAVFSVPGHFMFAVAMGYFYSQLFFGEITWRERSRIFWVPVLLHGIYDGILMVLNLQNPICYVLTPVFYVFFLRMYHGGKRRIKEHLETDRETLFSSQK